MKMRIRTLLLVSIAVGGLAAACGGSSASEEVAPDTSTEAPTAPARTVPSSTGQETPISTQVTPTSTPTPAATSAADETPTAAPTQPPAASATSEPAPTRAVPPTATAASANPMTANIGASGAGGRFFWSPSHVTIAPGGTVTWTWNEPVQPHNVSGANFALTTEIKKADSVSFTFAAPGSYSFACEVHPDTMRGTVNVQ